LPVWINPAVETAFLKDVSMRLLAYKQLGPEKGIWFCRTHIRRISDPKSDWFLEFPAAVQIGPGRIGWWEHELDDWLRKRSKIVPVSRSSEEEHLEPPLGKLPD
jgi:predicted DNA-binding transcriptional regulator AlpA